VLLTGEKRRRVAIEVVVLIWPQRSSIRASGNKKEKRIMMTSKMLRSSTRPPCLQKTTQEMTTQSMTKTDRLSKINITMRKMGPKIKVNSQLIDPNK